MAEIFEHGYAVIIGVDDNNIKRLALPSVAKDVTAVHEVFVHPERCAYNPENVKLISGADSTNENILEALSWLQGKVKADKDATAVIYYSGHGMVDKKTDKYYLIPYDIRKLSKVRFDAIDATEFNAEISDIQSNRLLVVLDCCHADGMDVKDIDLDAIEDDKAVEKAAFPLDADSVKNIPSYEAAPGAKAVSDLIDGNGRAILNSSTGSQSSYIRQDGAMSLFTYHFIEALTGHAPHPDDATVVYVTDVMSWVTHEVKKSAARENRQQTPVMRTTGVFPVAQLIGGAGLAKGMGAIPPDPLEPLPPAGTTVNFNQQEQTVSGTQINAAGDANIGHIGDNINTGGGAHISGVNTGGGDFTMGNKTVNQGDTVHGDKFTGDKVMGDKLDGDKITIGSVGNNNSAISIGRGTSSSVDNSTHTTTNSGDTINMSGDFRGANVNMKSTLNNVQQTIGSMSTPNNEDKQELQNLTKQLEQALAQVPATHSDDIEAVSQTTKALVDLAATDNPNKTMLTITGEGLKQAAKNLAAVTPDVLKIATGIVMTIGKMVGAG